MKKNHHGTKTVMQQHQQQQCNRLVSHDCLVLSVKCNAHRKPSAFSSTDLERGKGETKQIAKNLRQG